MQHEDEEAYNGGREGASPVCTELPINHDRGSSLNLFTSAILEPPLKTRYFRVDPFGKEK